MDLTGEVESFYHMVKSGFLVLMAVFGNQNGSADTVCMWHLKRFFLFLQDILTLPALKFSVLAALMNGPARQSLPYHILKRKKSAIQNSKLTFTNMQKYRYNYIAY